MVDDDSHRCRRNAEGLRRHNYEVNTAADGQAGWEEIQTGRYHLLITEIDLPRVTGVGLVKKLCAARIPTPVIMSTVILPIWEFDLLPWMQAVTILRKPYSIGKLLGLVKSVLPETAGVRAENVPASIWQSQPATDSLRR